MIWTLRLVLVLLGVSLCALHVPRAEGARALGRDLSSLLKRNAWWSKKSSEPATNSGNFFEEHWDVKRDSSLEQIVGCYTGECIPDLVLCSTQATTEELYSQCKLQHRLCTQKCLRRQMS